MDRNSENRNIREALQRCAEKEAAKRQEQYERENERARRSQGQ